MFRLAAIVDDFESNGYLCHLEFEAVGEGDDIQRVDVDHASSFICRADDDAGKLVEVCQIDPTVWRDMLADVVEHVRSNWGDFAERAVRSEMDWRDALFCDARR